MQVAVGERNLFDPFKMELHFSFAEVEVHGPTAFVYGPFTLAMSASGGGNETRMVGKFPDVLHRQSYGSWKFARLAFNSDKPTR
jgi:ketosteroid isomerase-like protein